MSGDPRLAARAAVGAVLTPWEVARGWAADTLGLAGVVLAIPIAILVLGSPIALAARLVIELLSRLLS